MVFFRIIDERAESERERKKEGERERRSTSHSLQLLLDLSKQHLRLGARRCLESHPLVNALRIVDFPTLVMFKRNERMPVYISE